MAKSTLEQLKERFPLVEFQVGSAFYWSPEQRKITYNPAELTDTVGVWALIHEAAHARLEHTTYSSDLELLLLEVEAWREAKVIAQSFSMAIDEEHIQDCLDTYRDWLHHRSTCPTCGIVSLQDSPHSYICHNCSSKWQVSGSRFCRPYRLSKTSAQTKKLPGEIPRATFQ